MLVCVQQRPAPEQAEWQGVEKGVVFMLTNAHTLMLSDQAICFPIIYKRAPL